MKPSGPRPVSLINTIDSFPTVPEKQLLNDMVSLIESVNEMKGYSQQLKNHMDARETSASNNEHGNFRRYNLNVLLNEIKSLNISFNNYDQFMQKLHQLQDELNKSSSGPVDNKFVWIAMEKMLDMLHNF